MNSNLKPIVDSLGRIRAQIAALEVEEKLAKEALKDLAPGSYEGDAFKLTVSSSDREQLDMKAVREKLSPQFIRAHTTTSTVRTLRTTIRGDVAANAGK